jgi:sigma-B regulation protein RsbU (phosphoserine phosphatase)
MPEKILIVDDSRDNRMLLQRILGKAGYETLEAADGEEAFERTVEALPDLVLLDIVMPRRDGFEVCSLLKRDSRTAGIPVIFLSALDESGDKIKGLEMGGADYITKPFDRGEVLARIQTQLNISRLTRELVSANRDLTEKQKRLDEDLKAAAQIQQSLLPKSMPELESFEFAWKFLPSETIGGDIFDVFPLDEDHLGIYMLDVSGHGVPAALVAVSVSQILNTHRNVILKKKTDSTPYYSLSSPAEVLVELDREYPLERFEKYFTIVYAVIRISDGRMVYSSAGHPPPVLMRRDGSRQLLEAGGAIIGLGGWLPFEEGEAFLEPGDQLVFYTDGIMDHRNDRGEFYGMERFQQTLGGLRRSSVMDLMNGVAADLEAFGGGATLQDDVSILGIEYRG